MKGIESIESGHTERGFLLQYLLIYVKVYRPGINIRLQYCKTRALHCSCIACRSEMRSAQLELRTASIWIDCIRILPLSSNTVGTHLGILKKHRLGSLCVVQ